MLRLALWKAPFIAVERHLNSATVKAAHPELGDDIKVMAARSDQVVRFTVAAAFVSAHVADVGNYLAKKAEIRDAAGAVVSTIFAHRVSVELNAADVPPDNLYLTVTGLSAEAGDDGEAGRGNRANGLITPYRPMTMESLAGKNPVNHVGKLYNFAAALIADDLVHQVAEIEAVDIYLASQIGRPIEEPQIVDARLRLPAGVSVAELRSRISDIVAANLARLGEFADDLLVGELGFDRWPLRLPTDAHCTVTTR